MSSVVPLAICTWRVVCRVNFPSLSKLGLESERRLGFWDGDEWGRYVDVGYIHTYIVPHQGSVL
jgi:hypothetical protein